MKRQRSVAKGEKPLKESCELVGINLSDHIIVGHVCIPLNSAPTFFYKLHKKRGQQVFKNASANSIMNLP